MEKKEEVGRVTLSENAFKKKSKFRVMMVSHGLSSWGVGFLWETHCLSSCGDP